MSSLKKSFSAFDAESKKVVKYPVLKEFPEVKESLRYLKNALKESVEEINKRPQRYNAGVIAAVERIMKEVTERMKKFPEIQKFDDETDIFNDEVVNNLFETAHECVNDIVTYVEDDIDIEFEHKLRDFDAYVADINRRVSSSSSSHRVPTPKPKTPTPKAKTPSPKPKAKTARCPRGTRRNKKTGHCESSTRTKVVQVADAADAASPASAPKMKRCPRGSRRNKKTGNCDKN